MKKPNIYRVHAHGGYYSNYLYSLEEAVKDCAQLFKRGDNDVRIRLNKQALDAPALACFFREVALYLARDRTS